MAIEKGSFIHNLLATLGGIPHASGPTVAVGALMVALLVAMERFIPRAPAPLIAVAIGIAGVGLFGLDRFGLETVGAVPTGLPAVTAPANRLGSASGRSRARC